MTPPADDTVEDPGDTVGDSGDSAAGPGDPASDSDGVVARLFAAHAAALRLHARQWVGAAAAEDVVQRVFVRLLAGRRLPDAPRTWLYKCVRNEAIDAARADRRRGRLRQAAAADADPWLVPRPDDPLDARAAEAALAMLPPRDREVVVLRVWSGLTLAEVAAVTGMPVSTVHDRYRAALAALRRQLEPSCETRNT